MTQTHNLNFDDLKYEVEVGNHADRASGSALVEAKMRIYWLSLTSKGLLHQGFQLSTDYRIRASLSVRSGNF